MGTDKKKIVIAENSQSIRMELYDVFVGKGFDVVLADSAMMLIDSLDESLPDLAVVDLSLPDMSGVELLRRIRERFPVLSLIVMTGKPSVDSAVEAMRCGVADYLIKPFGADLIEEAAGKALGHHGSAGEHDDLHSRLPGSRSDSRTIIGKNPKFLRVLDKADSVASSKATVLILGESGTGKEVIARYIHEKSSRCNGPFVALNCAALPDGLLESELFGHEKGAFTGAIMAKKGKFELADSGTLLLDEISEIPLHLQAKLLRVLQEEEVDRLGGKSPQKIDVHVVATTNRDLAEAVKSGSFRQDLYYRINVIPLFLPPLRERREDLVALTEYFLERYSRRYGKQVKMLSKEVKQYFASYEWPGNVRELENLIERGVLLSKGRELVLADFWDEFEDQPTVLPDQDDSPAFDTSVADLMLNAAGEVPTLRDVERQLILQALQKTDDNRTHAAEILGISVRTLRNKLHEYRNQGLIE